jgi:hypothetical protein
MLFHDNAYADACSYTAGSEQKRDRHRGTLDIVDGNCFKSKLHPT